MGSISAMSLDEVTSKLSAIMLCADSSCCCIPKKTTVATVAIINFLGCVVDLATNRTDCRCDRGRYFVKSAKKVLVSLFQTANMLLMLASVFEKPVLVDIYVWCTLGYIVMGFVVAIMEFVLKAKCEGGLRSLVTFVPEVLFLFVIFRCLPLVDSYRRSLHEKALASVPLCTPLEDLEDTPPC